jgi:hypothetical protein
MHDRDGRIKAGRCPVMEADAHCFGSQSPLLTIRTDNMGQPGAPSRICFRAIAGVGVLRSSRRNIHRIPRVQAARCNQLTLVVAAGAMISSQITCSSARPWELVFGAAGHVGGRSWRTGDGHQRGVTRDRTICTGAGRAPAIVCAPGNRRGRFARDSSTLHDMLRRLRAPKRSGVDPTTPGRE